MDRCVGGMQKFKITNLLCEVPDVVKLTPEQKRICQIYDNQAQFLDLPSTQAAMRKLRGFLAFSSTRLPIKDKIIILVGNSGVGKTTHALEALSTYNVTHITRDAEDLPQIIKKL